MRFNDLTFDAALLTARHADGAELHFTRKERALLVQLVARQGQLLPRAQLIEALGIDGSESGERTIDFIVNRLRAKLGDSARAPRFIATQYGEGYVWIARQEGEAVHDAFLVLGPVYGLGASGHGRHGILTLLTEAFERATRPDARIACVPDWRPNAVPATGVHYALEASFHQDGAALQAAFVLRDGAGRQVIETFRTAFVADPDLRAIEQLALRVRQAIWAHVAMPLPQGVVPTDTPLEIRMHDAALMLSRSTESWRENDAVIEQARAVKPDDPALAVMRGHALLARLILQVGNGKRPSSCEWREIEDEIETLALDSLPRVQDNPLLVLGVAKLLFFIDRGYLALAERLAEDAFAHSTAFAAAFATLGQLRMCRGAIPEAITLYDQGIELSEPGSEFRVYLLILKCTALLAADDRPALEDCCASLYATKPMTRMQVGLFMAAPNAPLPADLEMVLGSIDAEQAERMLSYLYHISARHFLAPTHRANVMKGLENHLERRFGKGLQADDRTPVAVATG